MYRSYSTKTCWGYWKAGPWMEPTRSTEGRATERNMEKDNKWRNGKVRESREGSEGHCDKSRPLESFHRGPTLHKGVNGDWLIDSLGTLELSLVEFWNFHINLKDFRILIRIAPYTLKIEVKTMKAHGGCGCKGPHMHSHGTKKR